MREINKLGILLIKNEMGSVVLLLRKCDINF